MICIKISTKLLSQCIDELSKGEGRKHKMTRNLSDPTNIVNHPRTIMYIR